MQGFTMADAGVTDREKETVCPYCQGTADQQTDPRRLKCDHVACGDCIQNDIDNNCSNEDYRCPLCRLEDATLKRARDLPSATLDVEQKPQDDVAASGFDASSPAAHRIYSCAGERPDDFPCGSCGEKAFKYCTKCDIALCIKHEASHDDIFRGHEKLGKEEFSRKKARYNKSTCSTHSEMEATRICTKCFKLACVSCVAGTPDMTICRPRTPNPITAPRSHTTGSRSEDFNLMPSASHADGATVSGISSLSVTARTLAPAKYTSFPSNRDNALGARSKSQLTMTSGSISFGGGSGISVSAPSARPATTSSSGSLFASNPAAVSSIFGSSVESAPAASYRTRQINTSDTTPFGKPVPTTNVDVTKPTLAQAQGSAEEIYQHPQFRAQEGQDTMVKNGLSQTIRTKHYCITAMQDYQHKSIEELRFEDLSTTCTKLRDRLNPTNNVEQHHQYEMIDVLSKQTESIIRTSLQEIDPVLDILHTSEKAVLRRVEMVVRSTEEQSDMIDQRLGEEIAMLKREAEVRKGELKAHKREQKLKAEIYMAELKTMDTELSRLDAETRIKLGCESRIKLIKEKDELVDSVNSLISRQLPDVELKELVLCPTASGFGIPAVHFKLVTK